MTCCVSALCDGGKSIILVADRMVGTGMIEGEPDIKKVRQLHKDWRVMIAGNDIAPSFPIIDDAKSKLGKGSVSVGKAMRTIYDSYCAERNAQAEAVYLAPLGWKMGQFNSPLSSVILPSSRKEIAAKIADYRLDVGLLVAGFDDRGEGHLFTLDDDDNRGRPQRHDIPGYRAIGSGSYGAMYMMAYREVSRSMPLRLVLYHAIEGKYFGERAGGVGIHTDTYIMRAGEPVFRIKEKVVEDYLFKLCEKLKPREFNQPHVDLLNSLPGTSIRRLPKLHRVKEKGDWIIRGESTRKVDSADPSE